MNVKKIEILRNLGSVFCKEYDLPLLAEGDVVEVGKEISREQAAVLLKPQNEWLAKAVEFEKPAELKAVPPEVAQPIEGRAKSSPK